MKGKSVWEGDREKEGKWRGGKWKGSGEWNQQVDSGRKERGSVDKNGGRERKR